MLSVLLNIYVIGFEYLKFFPVVLFMKHGLAFYESVLLNLIKVAFLGYNDLLNQSHIL